MMLKQLAGKIAPDKLRKMLDKALVACQKDYVDLQNALEQEDWEQAHKKAHSLKNTANLLECHEFTRCLETIEQNDLEVMSQPEFPQQLKKEYSGCLSTIQQLLDTDS